MPVVLQPAVCPYKTGPVFLLAGFAFNAELPFLSISAVVGESKKVEGIRFLVLRLSFGISPKGNNAGFVFRQFQVESCQPFFEGRVEHFRFLLVLKAADKVIGVADHVCLSRARFTHDFLKPQIQHVVKINISQYGGNHATLRRPFRCVVSDSCSTKTARTGVLTVFGRGSYPLTKVGRALALETFVVHQYPSEK